MLEQNYPNPFNPSTVISYALPVAGFVTLNVFNTLGQEVALLVHQQQQPGRFSVGFSSSSLSSGIYFYRLAVAVPAGGRDGFVSIRKMLLLK
jgi:hypothetical protein